MLRDEIQVPGVDVRHETGTVRELEVDAHASVAAVGADGWEGGRVESEGIGGVRGPMGVGAAVGGGDAAPVEGGGGDHGEGLGDVDCWMGVGGCAWLAEGGIYWVWRSET